MLLTNKEVVDILDERLDYSDFGNYSGNEDDLIEFAYYVVKAENEKMLKIEQERAKDALPIM